MRCRSWDCRPCLEFNTSKNDVKIIDTHMENMKLEEQLAQQKELLDEAIDVIYFYENGTSYSHGGSDFMGDCVTSNRAREFLAKIKR